MKALIIGAGPAAAGVALALSADPDVEVRVIDVGGILEPDNDAARLRMAATGPEEWSSSDVRIVSQMAQRTDGNSLPEKRNFGSDFPFHDFGQLEGVSGEGGVNTHVVSGAYGGFSTTWGAQTMVYSAASFNDWPFPRTELETDYRAILSQIPYAGEQDDLAEYHPLWGDADHLPPLSENAAKILDAYARHRVQVRRRGVIVGRARLALRASACVSCGLCMTGCPYSYVYSAAQTFDQLIAEKKITYAGGYLALRLGENDGGPFVEVRNLATGAIETMRADKIFVACGAIGTTRLVGSSLDMFTEPIHFQESPQFVMPFASIRAHSAITQDNSFTLNQFNLLLPFDEAGKDLVQIHGYPYNDAMDDAVPQILKTPAMRTIRAMVLKRLTVGLGYLPSWWTPGFDVTLERPASSGDLAPVNVGPPAHDTGQSFKRLRAVNARLLRVAPFLGVAPVLPMVSLSAPGKSYHFGGSFPHATNPSGRESDVLGRVDAWRSIHLVDASVFPTVSATTFTLTIMANAHRIARRLLEDGHG
jgi:choline dehydrogenase-like flavoprotein